MQATIHFHSSASARVFLASNKFHASEIVAQGLGFVTLTADASRCATWENNPHVYSVSWA